LANEIASLYGLDPKIDLVSQKAGKFETMIREEKSKQGGVLTKAEYDQVYERYKDEVRMTSGLSQVMADALALLSGQDVHFANMAADNALTNNFNLLAQQGVLAGDLGYIAYRVKEGMTQGPLDALWALNITGIYEQQGQLYCEYNGQTYALDECFDLIFTAMPALRMMLGGDRFMAQLKTQVQDAIHAQNQGPHSSVSTASAPLTFSGLGSRFGGGLNAMRERGRFPNAASPEEFKESLEELPVNTPAAARGDLHAFVRRKNIPDEMGFLGTGVGDLEALNKVARDFVSSSQRYHPTENQSEKLSNGLFWASRGLALAATIYPAIRPLSGIVSALGGIRTAGNLTRTMIDWKTHPYLNKIEVYQRYRTNRSAEQAAQGGACAGQPNKHKEQTVQELEKSIKSYRKQIDKHERLINDPKIKISEWDTFDKVKQENTIHHWIEDAARARAYQEMVKRVLRERINADIVNNNSLRGS
jgi:hypothetical protein